MAEYTYDEWLELLHPTAKETLQSARLAAVHGGLLESTYFSPIRPSAVLVESEFGRIKVYPTMFDWRAQLIDAAEVASSTDALEAYEALIERLQDA